MKTRVKRKLRANKKNRIPGKGNRVFRSFGTAYLGANLF
jgi:hypothetical protein